MPPPDPVHALRAVRRHPWLIGLVLVAGCAHSRTDLQDTLAQRVTPPGVGVGVGRQASQPEAKASDSPTNDATRDAAVRPVAALQDVQGRESGSESGRTLPLPPALDGPPARVDANQPSPPAASLPTRDVDSARSTPPAASLPSDSDEATLDAIAATGQPFTLAEAVEAAFRYQPRLHAQLETIAQAQGQQQIAFSTFLPSVGANYDVGVFNLGVGGAPIKLGPGLPGFNFVPGLGAVPVGLHIGTSFEVAELKVQWLLLDFGRRLGRYEQARLAKDIAGLQTERAFQTVANEVAIAYYTVLRTQALRRTAQDALRRAEDELTDARKLEREGVVDREVALRAEVQRAETRQQLHASTEAEFVALAGLNLAIGLKSSHPVRVADPPEIPPLATSLASCLQTAVTERREFQVVRHSVEIATEGGRVARADFAPKVIADGKILNFEQQSPDGHVDFRLGFIRLEWTFFEGGRRIAAARVADSQVRQAMAQAESIADNIAFQVNEAYRSAVTAWIGIDDARPAVDQATENYRLVQLRAREGAATPTEITDAQASLTRAQQNFLNARYSYLIAMDRLAYAMGVGQTPMTQACRRP